MRILGLIPARGGSKGIPYKNIKLLNGKPLIQYTIETAKQSSLLSNVILSSDDEAIIDVSRRLGLEAPFTRPQELAADATPTLPVIQHALQFYLAQGLAYDAVCLLQTTYPFRPAGFLDRAIQTFIDRQTDSLISVLEIPSAYNPHWAFEATGEGALRIATGEKTIIPRRQDLPTAYHRDGAIYLTRSEVVLNQNSLYGESIAYIESSRSHYVNIDNMADWEMAEQIAKAYEDRDHLPATM